MSLDVKNEFSLVKSIAFRFMTVLKPQFKYTLYNDFETDPVLETNSWNDVLDCLKEDTKFMNEGHKYYNRERETPWKESDLIEFIEENAEDIAHWCGYKLETRK